MKQVWHITTGEKPVVQKSAATPLMIGTQVLHPVNIPAVSAWHISSLDGVLQTESRCSSEWTVALPYYVSFGILVVESMEGMRFLLDEYPLLYLDDLPLFHLDDLHFYDVFGEGADGTE